MVLDPGGADGPPIWGGTSPTPWEPISGVDSNPCSGRLPALDLHGEQARVRGWSDLLQVLHSTSSSGFRRYDHVSSDDW
jgi:hypothetical protein